MNQEKFGNFIKEIRKNNNLTQKQLADKYNVTYQAVSKWENGRNMPDTALIKQMSEDFNISLEEMFEGELQEKQKDNQNIRNNIFLFLIILLFIVIIILIIIFGNNNDNFKFKTLSSDCDNFNISGNIAYNDKKSSIYITNIKYCGNKETGKYEEIECVLYESYDNIEKKISSYSYKEKKKITLDDFLETVTLYVDNYKKTCKEYSKNSLYLLINAKENNNKIITYKVPLILEKNCPN